MAQEILSYEPVVIHYPNFFTDIECDLILGGLEDEDFSPSMGFNFDKLKNRKTDWRTSSQHVDSHSNFGFVASKVSDFFGYPEENIETLQVITYKPGQQYKNHCDFFNYPNKKITDNDRVATAIAYLNNDFVGGETFFPKLNIKFKPKKGSVLFFKYDYDSYTINLNTTHAGLPVKSGQKYITTCWIRKEDWKSGGFIDQSKT
jgi:prolyl 4-hydroxylase